MNKSKKTSKYRKSRSIIGELRSEKRKRSYIYYVIITLFSIFIILAIYMSLRNYWNHINRWTVWNCHFPHFFYKTLLFYFWKWEQNLSWQQLCWR